jgi:hypothetical protein
MDWVVGILLGVGFLFFWAVWIFGYWLPMAKESQRQFKEQQAREERQRAARDAGGAASPPPG